MLALVIGKLVLLLYLLLNTECNRCSLYIMASINSITVEENQYQVTDAMAQIAATNLRRIHCDLVCDLLKTLLRKNIGTNDVENDVNKTLRYCTAPYKLSVKRKIMRQRLTDAYRKRNEAERQYWDTKKKSNYILSLILRKCKKWLPEEESKGLVAEKVIVLSGHPSSGRQICQTQTLMESKDNSWRRSTH